MSLGISRRTAGNLGAKAEGTVHRVFPVPSLAVWVRHLLGDESEVVGDDEGHHAEKQLASHLLGGDWEMGKLTHAAQCARNTCRNHDRISGYPPPSRPS
jgi:hypothetical protein